MAPESAFAVSDATGVGVGVPVVSVEAFGTTVGSGVTSASTVGVGTAVGSGVGSTVGVGVVVGSTVATGDGDGVSSAMAAPAQPNCPSTIRLNNIFEIVPVFIVITSPPLTVI